MPLREQLEDFLASYEKTWEIVESSKAAGLDPLSVDSLAKEHDWFRAEIVRIEKMIDLTLRDRLMRKGKEGKSVNVLMKLAATRMESFQDTLRVVHEFRGGQVSSGAVQELKQGWDPTEPKLLPEGEDVRTELRATD